MSVSEWSYVLGTSLPPATSLLDVPPVAVKSHHHEDEEDEENSDGHKRSRTSSTRLTESHSYSQHSTPFLQSQQEIIVAEPSIINVAPSTSPAATSSTSSAIPRLSRLHLLLVFITCGVCWGSALLFINKCLKELDPSSIALGRCSISFILLMCYQIVTMFAPYMGTSEIRQQRRKEFITSFTSLQSLTHMLILGLLFSVIASQLIAVSEIHLSSGITSILLMLEPLLAPFIGHAFLTKEQAKGEAPINRYTIIGLLLGLVGTTISSLPSLDGSSDTSHPLSLIFAIGASVTFAIGSVVGTAFASRRPVLHRIIGQLGFGAIMLIPITMLLRHVHVFDQHYGTTPMPSVASLSAETVLWLFALSVISTISSWFLFYILLQQLGSLATSVNFLIPPVAIILGAIFNNEWSSEKGVTSMNKAEELGGMSIVLTGVACVMYAIRKNEEEERKRAEMMERMETNGTLAETNDQR